MSDGSWTRLDAVEGLISPQDLVVALQKQGRTAQLNFDAFPRSVKRSIPNWILNAKRGATRERRVVETACRAEKNERANQWRR